MSKDDVKPAFDEATAKDQAIHIIAHLSPTEAYQTEFIDGFVTGARWQWEEVGQQDYTYMLKWQAHFNETLQKCEALRAERDALKAELELRKQACLAVMEQGADSLKNATDDIAALRAEIERLQRFAGERLAESKRISDENAGLREALEKIERECVDRHYPAWSIAVDAIEGEGGGK